MGLIERKELEEIKATIDERLNTLTRDMERRIAEYRDQMADVRKKTIDTVAERPLLALGVAFALGMTLGIALSGSRH